MSAWCRQEDSRAWVDAWVPACFNGRRCGNAVQDAFFALLDKATDVWMLGTADLMAVFDMVAPVHAMDIM